MLIDEKFKDSSPEQTVDTIIGILSDYGMQAEETWMDSTVQNCYSVRVSIKGAEFGANGKGITKELARASGYAELMERMQAGYLVRRHFRDEMVEYADVKEIALSDFSEYCGQWMQNISAGLSSLFGSHISAANVMQKCFEADATTAGTIRVLPFYNVIDDEISYFPQKIIPALYNTNGLAAGNTYEEAFVQGFSEVIERNLMVKCFFNDITPPDVPEDYLRQFERSFETIEYLRNRGFDIYIKDCSMGCPFPLLAAVAVDKKHHSYHVHMGAHPVFEIALERCLTEMFQGRTINTFTNTAELFIGNAKDRSISELLTLLTDGCGRYSASFFSGTPSYDFKPALDRSGMSNRELLKEIVDYVKSLGYKMLVRSIAHLGFTSVRILIPGMSEALPNNLTDSFPQLGMMNKHRNSATEIPKMNAEQRQEYKMLLQHQVAIYGASATDYMKISGRNVSANNRKINQFIGRMVFACLEWDTNRDNALKFAKAVLPMAPEWAESKLFCLQLLFDYLKKGCSLEKSVEELRVFFEDDVITYVHAVFVDGMNPFEQFIPNCTLTDCAQCHLHETCNIKNTDIFIQKVKDAVLQFNNEKAFEDIKKLFCSL